MSHRLTRIAALAFLALACAPALAAEDLRSASEEDVARRCSEAIYAWRVEEAQACADEALRRDPVGALGHGLAAQVAFLRGDYAAARDHADAFDRAGGAGMEEFRQGLERLRAVHAAFQERESEHFRFVWANAADGVLAEYAPDVLERAVAALGEKLRYDPLAGKIRVEVYPDVDSFSAASTLALSDIERTGVVGICKFNRIMIVSPRVYVRGYPWCDSLAHELTHYVIIHRSANRIPVWLHEGIAKRCETLWRQPDAEAVLSPLQTTLLAEAREQDHFITFEQMHPSLAKLDSQQDAALAFAEAVSFVRFLEEQKGEGAPADVLDRVEAGAETPDALAAVTGTPFDALCGEWKDWIRTQDFERMPGVRVLPRRLSEGGDNTERSGDLAGALPEAAYRFARLGDMLRDQSRYAAAAVEYRKATAQSDLVSPELHVRLAQMLILSGGADEARPALGAVERYYDDYLPLYLALADLHNRQGERDAAVAAFETAIRINPFDPRPHEALAALYGKAGRTDAREREERALKILREWLRR